MPKVFKLLKFFKYNKTTYRPQSNGALEKSHLTLGNYLQHWIDKNLAIWENFIPDATRFQSYEWNEDIIMKIIILK